MKSNLSRLIKWFCRHLTFNDLASAVVVFHEILSGVRKDIALKPNEKPPHYRVFQVDRLCPSRRLLLSSLPNLTGKSC